MKLWFTSNQGKKNTKDEENPSYLTTDITKNFQFMQIWSNSNNITRSIRSWSSGVASAPRSRGAMASKSSCLISSIFFPLFSRNEGKNETFVLQFGAANGLESSNGLRSLVGTGKRAEDGGRWKLMMWRFLWVVWGEREGGRSVDEREAIETGIVCGGEIANYWEIFW